MIYDEILDNLLNKLPTADITKKESRIHLIKKDKPPRKASHRTPAYYKKFCILKNITKTKSAFTGYFLSPITKKEALFKCVKRDGSWNITVLYRSKISEDKLISFIYKGLRDLDAKEPPSNNARTPIGFSLRRCISKNEKRYNEAIELGIITKQFKKAAMKLGFSLIYRKRNNEQVLKVAGNK